MVFVACVPFVCVLQQQQGYDYGSDTGVESEGQFAVDTGAYAGDGYAADGALFTSPTRVWLLDSVNPYAEHIVFTRILPVCCFLPWPRRCG